MVGIHEYPKYYRNSAVHVNVSTKTSIKLHIYKDFSPVVPMSKKNVCGYRKLCDEK